MKNSHDACDIGDEQLRFGTGDDGLDEIRVGFMDRGYPAAQCGGRYTG